MSPAASGSGDAAVARPAEGRRRRGTGQGTPVPGDRCRLVVLLYRKHLGGDIRAASSALKRTALIQGPGTEDGTAERRRALVIDLPAEEPRKPRLGKHQLVDSISNTAIRAEGPMM